MNGHQETLGGGNLLVAWLLWNGQTETETETGVSGRGARLGRGPGRLRRERGVSV
jgi:hypothetical protein